MARLVCGITLGICAWIGPARAEDLSRLAEAGRPVIEFPTVAAARGALSHRTGAQVYSQDGWMIVTENDGLTLWSFVPENHAAYPAVVKRVFSQNGTGAWIVNMSVHCEATKEACDRLVLDFNTLNEQMRKDIENRTGRRGQQ